MKNWKFTGSSQINFISEEQMEAFSRELGTDVICILPEGVNGQISLQQAILNKRYASFGYWATLDRYCQAGGRNEKLEDGWQYELFVRLAEGGTVGCIADARVQNSWALPGSFYADAYVLSRHMPFLQECGCFDAFLESCVHAAASSSDLLSWLEKMIRKDGEYWEIYQASQPFLILLGGDFCYNILNDMAENLAKGLRLCGKKTEFFDLAKDMSKPMDVYYQAVIGFQSFLSHLYLKNRGCYLTDLLYGPKLEMVFDHPFWFYKQLKHHGKDLYILVNDENYATFVQENEPSVSGSFLLPPGGMIQENFNTDRDLDLVFLGTYNNYRKILEVLYHSDKNARHMAARYLSYLKKELNAPAEKAFAKMLTDYGIEIEKENFAKQMHQMGIVCQCVMYYYREKIIQTLLDGGLSVHVYGESWISSPFAKRDGFLCHPEVTAKEGRNVLQRAKISLNVLAWHKGGCNERIINSMLSGAAVVTDTSSYIQKHFENGRELCCYHLQALHMLPKICQNLLEDPAYRQQIADSGKKKAKEEYSVLAQAERVISITRQINSCHNAKQQKGGWLHEDSDLCYDTPEIF